MNASDYFTFPAKVVCNKHCSSADPVASELYQTVPNFNETELHSTESLSASACV